MPAKKFTVGDLRRALAALPDETELEFAGGLTFNQLNRDGDNSFVIEFAEGQAESVSSVRNIGRSLFTDHAFAFEATSVLILVAMVGAIVLARKEH